MCCKIVFLTEICLQLLLYLNHFSNVGLELIIKIKTQEIRYSTERMQWGFKRMNLP